MVRVFVLLCCFTSLTSRAQSVVFSAGKKLTTFINKSDCEEILPLLSPDGKTLYFVRASCQENTGGKFAGSDVWTSSFDVNTHNWGRADKTKDLFNDKGHNAVIGISNDGETIYQFNSNALRKTPGIYSSKRLSNSWAQARLISLPFLDSEEFLGVYVSPDFSVILISMKRSDSRGQEDIYVSLKSLVGEWSSPRNLGSVINTKGFEISPFLSADTKRLYFASNGHQGLGNADIFYSERLDESWENWSTPVNLGSKVNSKGFDAYFSIYDSIAYFSSNRESQLSDLYVVKVKSTEDSTEQQIRKIVAEARSILTDLGDDTTDSLATDLKSIFIGFDNNSVQMDSKAIAQLNSVVDRIKKRKSNRIILVAYSNEHELQNEKLCYRRLEVIRTYLVEAPMPNLKIEVELKKKNEKMRENRNGIVEVRYEQ